MLPVTTTKFTLPISPTYVASWGLWEAVREIYQNALDEQTKDPACEAYISYANDDEGTLYIGSHPVMNALAPSSLLLGNTSKATDGRLRGQHGEGYKLALLVLSRMGFPTKIRNGQDTWRAAIEHDKTFDSQVLNIHVEHNTQNFTGVEFVITDVSTHEWDAIKKNIRNDGDVDTILLTEQEKGRVYSGGLYVCTMKDFDKGYSFAPGTIKLDRDRGLVDNFDLSMATSRLWTNADHGNDGVELLKKGAPDVAYVEYQSSVRSSPLALKVFGDYEAEHADAVPVSTQAEIEDATAAGVKWALVKEPVKALLNMVKQWFIPKKVTSPAARLRTFLDDNSMFLSSAACDELRDIIKQLDGGTAVL